MIRSPCGSRWPMARSPSGMLTRSMRITRQSQGVLPGGGSRSTTRQDRRHRRQSRRSPHCHRRRRARGCRCGADPTPRPAGTPARGQWARAQPTRGAQRTRWPQDRDRRAMRRRPLRSSRRGPSAAAGQPELPWHLRPRPQAAADGVFPATRPSRTSPQGLPSRPPYPIDPALHPSMTLADSGVAYAHTRRQCWPYPPVTPLTRASDSRLGCAANPAPPRWRSGDCRPAGR